MAAEAISATGVGGRRQPLGGALTTSRASGWRRRAASIRARSTIVVVLVVAAALAVGAVGLLTLLRTSLQEGVESTAQAQVDDIASLLRLGPLPAQLPTGRGDLFTQVVGPGGTVVASSPTLTPDETISHLHPDEEGAVVHDVPVLDGLRGAEGDPEGPYLLLSRSVQTPTTAGGRGIVTVYVAGSLHTVVEATRTLTLALAAGLPVFVILVGLLVWFFSGRALRPVEEIRSEVADITLHDLHRRVSSPATHDEVDRLASTMNEMLDRLESSSATQRRFVADASHELRSPLAALQATLEVAIAHPDDAALTAATSDALDEARRLQRLIDDLLALARADELAGPPTRDQLVDLDEIVFREARRRAPTERVAIDVHGVSGGRVEGDAAELTRVVRNLVDNACRHAATTVTISLSSSDREVTLVVADDGMGIAPDARERIFERFTRLDEGRSRDRGGAGLGLAIVRDLVGAHGGTIVAGDNEPGARFEVALPNSGGWH